jgi:pyruvate dehydrogenase E2 component (dihydrolipoamide acetyltransferase)
VFASPLARRLAKEAGLPVESVTGTGPNARITKRDVEAALATFVDRPHTRMRRTIATRLQDMAPQFHLRGSADVEALTSLRAELNAEVPKRVSMTDLIVKAVGQAHRRVPEMNVNWTPETTRVFSTVDVGIAIATDGGLVTPVIRSVDTLSITAIADISADLIDRARRKALRQHELEGGTITVTNLGMYGTEEFAAIINPPQAAILAVGAVRPEPIVRDGQVAVGAMMRCTLSVDHRPVDGVTAARWLREFLGLLENPVRILA